MITGKTEVIAHLGVPTEAFKAPSVYNPYFHDQGLDVIVVPMGCEAEHFADLLPLLLALRNLRGAIITMPHKMAAATLVDEPSATVRVSGACNAVRVDERGRLVGEMFDGEGFVRGVERSGRTISGAAALVVGSGGVGSAIAASLAEAGAISIGVFDTDTDAMARLATRLRSHYDGPEIVVGSNDPSGYDIVVNATPLGMEADDQMPVDVNRISPQAFVGEVVMKHELTPFLRAAADRGCQTQVGVDMLFEQIPAYLEFFGLPTTSPDVLRRLAEIDY